ncbi:MAG: hypothetical protein ACU84J_09170 [Gammaproteobacteria bacterium]
MATYSKLLLFGKAFICCLALFGANPVNAAYVEASSDMVINNLRFEFGDPNAQLQWTDVWYGEVRAHAADSDSSPADDRKTILSNNDTRKAEAKTTHVKSMAEYTVANGDLIGINPDAGVTGSAQSGLKLEEPNKQADGFAYSAFDNFFEVTNPNDPNAQGPVQIDFSLDYDGTIFGSADAQGFFVDITHIATLRLLDETGLLLNFDSFQDSISGTNTTITRPHQGTLTVSYLLDYNTTYWISAEADAEIYGYTVPSLSVLPLILVGLGVMFSCRRRVSVR